MSNNFFNNLETIKKNYLNSKNSIPIQINICAGTGCIANGALKVIEEFKTLLSNYDINVVLSIPNAPHQHNEKTTFLMESGCHGFCQMGPLVEIKPLDILYTKVKPNDVINIIEKTLLNNIVIEELLYKDHLDQVYSKAKNIPFYALQFRNTLDKCGRIDSTDIRAYIAENGYFSAYNA